MTNWLFLIISFYGYMSFSFIACTAPVSEEKLVAAVQNTENEEASVVKVIPAAERTAIYYPELKGKKIACIVNHTSMVGGKHLVDTLVSLELDIYKIFAPEHGFRGEADDGAVVQDGQDSRTGLPIISLYGSKKKPSAEDLEGVELVLFDIQDVGVRCYTFISTMHLVMEACAELDIPFMVLDRPNPNGYFVDGPVLDMEFSSFVGMHRIPLVYGLTIGELASMINNEGWLKDGLKADLTVIPCKNYTHSSFYQLPVKPSPNLPNIKSILLYPSLVLFEGTSISIGRGTDKQFQLIGHPAIKHRSFMFTPESGPGSSNPKHKGETCYGENLQSMHIGDLMDAKRLNLSWLIEYHKILNEQEIPFFLETNYINKLAGTDKLQMQIKDGWTEEEIRNSWEPELTSFKELRNNYLMYPD